MCLGAISCCRHSQRNLQATDEKKRAVEARCQRLDIELEEVKRKTNALLDKKRRSAASDTPAVRPKDEKSGTKESRVSQLNQFFVHVRCRYHDH